MKTSMVFEVAVEILLVKMLDDLAARDDAPSMMHEIGQQAIFVARELDRRVIDRDAPGARVSRTGPTARSLVAWPAARRISARRRASTSSIWKGLAT